MKLPRYAVAVWIVSFVLCLVFWAAVIVVAIHFIRKEW